jgi:hypothetical protein
MEGYALYPYRASAPKNRFRWTFGVLAPRAWSEAEGCEPWWLEAQVLVEGAPTAVHGQLRGFQIERRRVVDAAGHAVEALEEDGRLEVPWDEGVEHVLDFALGESSLVLASTRHDVPHGSGCVIRERHGLVLQISATLEPLATPLTRVTVRVANVTPWLELVARRTEAMSGAFASAHLVLAVDGGRFISAIDPPDWAMAEASRCTNTGTYPVLVGDVMLAAPFAMYDHARIAPESAGDLCDATEIDELLVLRARLMTDREKREARATDPRAAAIVDRADALPDAKLARMHGATRELADGEMVPAAPRAGAKVRLRAPTRTTDAQDLLYQGRIATVAEVKRDVDGSVFLAVTIDDDPAAELHGWYGRYHHYRLDEVDVL